MPVSAEPDPAAPPLLDRMVASRQLSPSDSEALLRSGTRPTAEDDVLRWLAGEYGLTFSTLEVVEPGRDLLALFPARVLLREELLPLRRVNGCVEVATSRLFATQGLDALKTLSGLRLTPVLAPTEAIQR